jgi:hypothetical protein
VQADTDRVPTNPGQRLRHGGEFHWEQKRIGGGGGAGWGTRENEPQIIYSKSEEGDGWGTGFDVTGSLQDRIHCLPRIASLSGPLHDLRAGGSGLALPGALDVEPGQDKQRGARRDLRTSKGI